MGLELVGPSKRTLAGILCWFFETTGLAASAAVAYGLRSAGVRSWRFLQAAYSAPAAAFLAYRFLTPESPRWLLAAGKKRRARKVIERTAKVNGVEVPEGMLDRMEETAERERRREAATTKGALELFRHPQMRAKTAALTLCWVVCSALYYVLLLDQSELSDDPYLGFLATCAVQIPGYVYVILTLELPLLGRKRSLCAMLLLSGAALVIHPFLDDGPARVAVSIAGRFCANCSYTVLHLFSAELFPTVARGAGLGYCYVVSRLGSASAPYLLLALGADRGAPVAFGVGAIAASAAAIMLPETLGTDLPESMADEEKIKMAIPFSECKRRKSKNEQNSTAL